MIRRTGGFVGLIALALLALWRCTLLTGGFKECAVDGDCRDGSVCAEGYCVVQTTPAGCLGLPDAGIAAVYGAADAGNAIHLGAAIPLSTGTGLSASDVQHVNALVLALEEVNQREGVGGRPFALHVCDTQGDLNLLKAQLAWMSERQGVPAVIVSNSAPVLTAASVTIPRGMLLMSATATSPEITYLADAPDGGVGLVWRTAPSDAIQGKVISELLLGTSSFDAGLASVGRVGIVYVNDPYGQGLSSMVLTAVSGAKTAGAFQYNQEGDVSTAVSQLNAMNPDLSLLVGFPEDAPRIVTAGAAQANLARGAGHQWFFTDSAKDPALIAQSPAGELEGNLGTAPAQGAGAAYTVFRASFMSRFGGVDPDSYAFIAHSYDALYLLALGAAHAAGADGTGGVTGRRIAEGLTRLSSGAQHMLGPMSFTAAKTALQGGASIDVEGASGRLDFNPATGEAPSPIELWQVSGSGFRTVQVIEPGP